MGGTSTLILSEDEAGTELHKEHHSGAAGLNQRLAAAELDGWDGLIERALQKQQERAIFKANNRCLGAAKQIMMGSRQAAPCEETTKMIQAKLPRDELPERKSGQ